MTYEIDIAGLKRDLPLCPLNDQLSIAGFVLFGDVELTVHCAAELLKIAPDYDYMIAPEAKSIPLIYEMARQSGAEHYFVARKKAKAYMTDVFEVISTGESLHAMEELCAEAGATVVGKMAVLAEGDAAKREDITVLAPLPLFHPDGTPIEA